MSIYLIRHGETIANTKRVLQMPQSPLSDRGMRQAESLSNRLATADIGQVLSSDYPRARHTAEIINEPHRLAVKSHELLRERHFGDWRGRSYDEVSKDRLNDDLSPPNGEDTNTFFARISHAWQYLKHHAQQCNGITVAVSHGLACRALIQNHVPLAAGLEMPDSWSNTSLTVIEYLDDWLVTRINCVEHLDSSLKEQ